MNHEKASRNAHPKGGQLSGEFPDLAAQDNLQERETLIIPIPT
jgi:hypothetical protein